MEFHVIPDSTYGASTFHQFRIGRAAHSQFTHSLKNNELAEMGTTMVSISLEEVPPVEKSCPKQSLQADAATPSHATNSDTYLLCSAMTRRTVQYHRHTNHVLLHRE
jgi:hypothetical protein